jgi:hypothetical protein
MKADQMLASVPEDVKADVASIVERYGDLDHRSLLKTLYKKYPVYAAKSEIKKKAGEQ